MRRLTLMLTCLFVLFCATGVMAQRDEPLPRKGLPRDGIEFEPRVEIRPEIMALYYAIAPLQTTEQRRVLVGVAPEVKSRLWMYNMYVFLDSHSDLTAPQRAAIRRNLRYVSNPHVFASLTDSAEIKLDEAAMDEVAAVIDAAGFTPEFATTAFIHLGPVAVRVGPPSANSAALIAPPLIVDERSPKPTTYPDCMCKVNISCWEYYATYCDIAYFYCLPNNNCGYDGKMPCVGVCTNGGF